jgi:hypothetical protein
LFFVASKIFWMFASPVVLLLVVAVAAALISALRARGRARGHRPAHGVGDAADRPPAHRAARGSLSPAPGGHAARPASSKCERQPSSSSRRASANALAASVGLMLLPCGARAQRLVMTASTAGFDAGMRLPPRIVKSASRRTQAFRRHACCNVDWQAFRFDDFTGAVDNSEPVVQEHMRLEAGLPLLVGQSGNKAFEIEFDRDQAGIMGDALQGVSVRAFVRQVDADYRKGRAFRPKGDQGHKQKRAHRTAPFLIVSLARPARKRSAQPLESLSYWGSRKYRPNSPGLRRNDFAALDGRLAFGSSMTRV